MDTYAIPLTATQRRHLRKRVASGDFRDAGSYLQLLVDIDLERTAALEDALREGLESGLSDRSLDEIIADIKDRYRADQAA